MARLLTILFLCATVLSCNRLDPLHLQVDGHSGLETDRRSFRVQTGGKEPALNLAVVPYRKDESLIHLSHNALVHYLARGLDRKIRFIVTSDYQQLADLVSQGMIHMGIFNTQLYYNIRRKSPRALRYVATSLFRESTAPSYRGVIFSRKNGLKNLSQLKGRSFAFTDQNSTSGYLYAVDRLLNSGINPFSQLKRYSFAGDHTAVIDLVLSGAVDAGVSVEGVFERLEAEQKENLHILVYTSRIPNDAFCVTSSFPPEKVEQLRALLQSIDETSKIEPGGLILGHPSFPYRGWRVQPAGYYDRVEKVYAKVAFYTKKSLSKAK